MKEKVNMQVILIRVICGAGLVGTVVVPADSAIAEETLSDALTQCSVIEDSSDRLGCFDNLVLHRAEVDAAPEAVVQADTVPVVISKTETQKAPDDLGAEILPLGSRRDVEKLEVLAMVTSCKKNSLGKYYFYFDNGHVWKQKSDKRLRFAKCEFEVTITQDVFGYKMQRVGDTTKIRIARVK